jgi:pantetheine-phosphate adenylyltransferase
MIAVYPGSFDPVTEGHHDIIKRAARMYDKVIVLVAVNSSKSALFTADERVDMLEKTCSGLPNVAFDRLEGSLLVDYAQANGADVIVRGLRFVSDFEYEFQMALLNRRLQPDIETVFMMASSEHSFLSSSIVKEIGRLGGQIEGLVPDVLLPVLRAKFGR